jgi:putative ABC transport system permease protein
VIRRLGQLLRLSLRNLGGYPLRTVLAATGVAFGVAAVVTMMAIAAGTERALLREIGRLGIENVILNTVKPPAQVKDRQTTAWRYDRYGLTFKDERRIRATVPGLRKVLPVLKQVRTVWWGSRKAEATVHAVNVEHLRLFGLDVERGRTLAAMDEERLARVCLVRSGLLRKLGVFEDPLGLPLQVGDHYYRIVGILPDQAMVGYAGKALGVDPKTTEIYVPYETVLHRIGTRQIVQKQGSTEMTDIQLSQLVVSVQDAADVLVAARLLQRLLDAEREQRDYEMVVPLEHLEQERKTKQIFAVFLLVIACISLVVGAVGIVNIMLATVTERTREIGVRRAMGAKRRHIIGQFLAETTVLAAAGGLLGVGLSFGFTAAMRSFFGFETLIVGASIVLALGISVAVGIASGVLPALRAAHLDPIAALRHE